MAEETALLDSGATENFIDHATIVPLRLGTKKLEKYNLFLKPEKCKFHQCEVEYLGVIIGNGTVKMDLVKIQGIMEWPTPKTVKDV